MIANIFPGVGDPWSLTLDQWTGLLNRIGDVQEMEHGRNHRAFIERMRIRRDE